jgi:glutamine amidotransferase
MTDIAVVDYGMGNLRSVAKSLEHVAPGKVVTVTSDPGVLRSASRVVFPGQGAMPDCMREIDARGLRAPLLEAARSKPFLGLCIGLQMLFESSEEGGVEGLGILSGKVVRFPAERMLGSRGEKLKVPHMGWNQVYQTMAHPLWAGIADASRFYFVHSYYVSKWAHWEQAWRSAPQPHVESKRSSSKSRRFSPQDLQAKTTALSTSAPRPRGAPSVRPSGRGPRGRTSSEESW